MPIQDPDEMDLTLDEASARVGLPVRTISRALASYVRSLLSGDAPFDRFADGDRTALAAEQEDGLRLFRGKGNCVACHVGPTFTDEMFHNTGVAWRAAGSSDGAGSFADEGRFLVTGRLEDRGAFKTPALREVARTAPYMHDGSLTSLDDVVEFYDRGGRANPHLDAELRPLGLSPAEKKALVAFLHALSGTVRQ